MKIHEAKLLHKLGAISDAIVLHAPDGWYLEFTVDSSKQDFPNRIHTDRGDERVFKSVDAAVSTARAIGFDKVTVVF